MTAWAAAWQHTPILEVTVRGLPVPQGSIRSLGAGRPSVHSNAATLKPWRESVQHELEEARTFDPISGPVFIECIFTVAKPKSAPKRKRTWPTSRPDIDKLARAILDAATASGVIGDDAQVIDLHPVKTFPLEHPDALDTPGVVIRLALVHDGTEPAAPAVSTADGIPW